MGDKKKKIIKYTLILSCIVLVVVATVVLQALNKSPVFAKSIISMSSTITRDSTDEDLYIYDCVKIYPSNYNQGLKCRTSSENVEVNDDGEIKFLEDEHFVTITVFAKSNQSNLIHTSFDVVLNEYNAPTIEKDLIKINAFDVNTKITNKLNYAENSIITVSSLNNLANYDYVTGDLIINENKSQSCMYDKITIEILSHGVKFTLKFEICIIKELSFNLEDEYCVLTFKNTLTKNDEYINVVVTNQDCAKYLGHRDSDATIAFLAKGSTEIEIFCCDFKYFYNINII